MRKSIYTLGQKLRNPSLKIKYLFLKESEKWSLKDLEQYQLQKLKELLEIAYNHSEFYKRKFDELNVDITIPTSFLDISFLS